MNIDELKDAWNKDDSQGMNLSINPGALGKTNSAVSRLRKNMKAEFIATIVSYPIIILVLFFFGKARSPYILDLAKILLFSVLLLNCFYFFKFYVFYKSIGRYDLNVKNSIRKIVYELELNAEIYKTYNFSAMSLSILTAAAMVGSRINLARFNTIVVSGSGIATNVMLMVCAIILISYIITYFFISLHVRLTYGKYLRDLKQVMDDLDDLS
jgi:hypothetical protein